MIGATDLTTKIKSHYHLIIIFIFGGLFTGGMAFIVQGRAFSFENVPLLAVTPAFFVGFIGTIIISALVIRNRNTLLERLDVERRISSDLKSEIAEREQAEIAVREGEERHRLLTELSPDAVFVHIHGKIVYANPAMVRLMGAGSADELAGMTALDVVHPDHHDRIERFRDEIAAAGTPTDLMDLRYVACDGSAVEVESSAAPLKWRGRDAFMIVARDLTERRRTEAALRESETLLRIVADASPVLISYIDRDRHIRFANKAFAARHGFTPDEILGKHQSEYWGDDTHLNIQDVIGQTLAGQVTMNEGVREHADGSIHYHLTTRAPHFDENGEVLGYFNIILDTTDQKRAEEQLAQAQKMEAVGQLTGGIAHDFNNLLTVIMGGLEFIEQRLDDRRLKTIARTALDASRRGAELTHRLLAYSRNQPLAPKVIDLNECVAQMTQLMRTTFGETIVVEARSDPDLWLCKADPGQIESAVLNLAINARDAMPRGGRIGIETGNIRLGEDFAASRPGFAIGDYVVVSVSDTGRGIPPEDLDRVFEPFFTTKEVGEGSGLGLSMVYGFIKQSDGEVEVVSEQGSGTTIRLYLPRSLEARRPVEQTAQDEVPRGRGEKILLVEDQVDVRDITVYILEDLGYQVVASQGDEALEKLRTLQPFDLLLSDIVLPGELNGVDVARRALRINPAIKVVLITGYAKDVVTRIDGTGIELEVLRKPFDGAVLGRKIPAVLDEEVD